MSRVLTAILFVLAALPAAAQTTRQGAAQSQEADAVAVLTREIRALREEIARTSRASLTLQLLTARIQAQEQRIIYLDRQRSEAVTRRASAEAARNAIAGQIQMFTGDTSKTSPEQRREMEAMVKMFKSQIETHDTGIAQMQTEENDAAAALAQEQSRWADLNQRLEDLERSLK